MRRRVVLGIAAGITSLAAGIPTFLHHQEPRDEREIDRIRKLLPETVTITIIVNPSRASLHENRRDDVTIALDKTLKLDECHLAPDITLGNPVTIILRDRSKDGPVVARYTSAPHPELRAWLDEGAHFLAHPDDRSTLNPTPRRFEIQLHREML